MEVEKLIEIIVPGRLSRHLRPSVEYYLVAVGKYTRVRLTPVELGGDLNRVDAGSILRRESERILRNVGERRFVLLDVHGYQMSSEEFARLINENLTHHSYVIFVVGGPLGVHEELRECAHIRLSLSKMTLNHELCVVVLLEQIFRAFKILRGERYHY